MPMNAANPIIKNPKYPMNVFVFMNAHAKLVKASTASDITVDTCAGRFLTSFLTSLIALAASFFKFANFIALEDILGFVK